MCGCALERDRRVATDARRLKARLSCCGGWAACVLRLCSRARSGCGRYCAVRPMKLTACTIISKPQNTRLLANQKASYRREQTRRASGRATGATRRDGSVAQHAGVLRGGVCCLACWRLAMTGRANRRSRRLLSLWLFRDASLRRTGREPPGPRLRASGWVLARLLGSFGRTHRSAVLAGGRRVCGAGAVRSLPLGGLAASAKSQDALAFRPVPISGARSLLFAMSAPRLPIFWALLQKKGPKFDIIPELLSGFRGTFSCRIFPTWGNACIRGCFSPFSPAKPPRSSDNPIAVA